MANMRDHTQRAPVFSAGNTPGTVSGGGSQNESNFDTLFLQDFLGKGEPSNNDICSPPPPPLVVEQERQGPGESAATSYMDKMTAGADPAESRASDAMEQDGDSYDLGEKQGKEDDRLDRRYFLLAATHFSDSSLAAESVTEFTQSDHGFAKSFTSLGFNPTWRSINAKSKRLLLPSRSDYSIPLVSRTFLCSHAIHTEQYARGESPAYAVPMRCDDGRRGDYSKEASSSEQR
jgi:hypothetical protein